MQNAELRECMLELIGFRLQVSMRRDQSKKKSRELKISC